MIEELEVYGMRRKDNDWQEITGKINLTQYEGYVLNTLKLSCGIYQGTKYNWTKLVFLYIYDICIASIVFCSVKHATELLPILSAEL